MRTLKSYLVMDTDDAGCRISRYSTPWYYQMSPTTPQYDLSERSKPSLVIPSMRSKIFWSLYVLHIPIATPAKFARLTVS